MLAPSTALIPLVLSLFTALRAPLLLLDILKISLTAIKCREHLLIYMNISGTGSHALVLSQKTLSTTGGFHCSQYTAMSTSSGMKW